MKKLWQRIKEWFLNLNFHKQFWIAWLLFVIIALIIICLLFVWIFLINNSTNNSTGKEFGIKNLRDLGWFVSAVISFIGLSIGLWLAIWGRQIQHKSHLHDRLEKATTMLGSEVMGIRIAGCRSLMSLGIEDKNMKSLCVRLLFAFINNPYLKPEHQGKSFDRAFPRNEPLRADIKEASNSFSAIYNHYGDKGIDNEKVILPYYFWENQRKRRISLIKVNLSDAGLKEIRLSYVNFQGANLSYSRLQGSRLSHANFQGANLERIKLQEAYLPMANFQGAYLVGANFQGANLFLADLEKTDLRKVKLKEVSLEKAKLKGANLSYMDLRGGKLKEANLQEANLKQADLREANLIDVNFRGANLRQVDLSKAAIGSAIFQDADLTGANVTDVNMNSVKNLSKKQLLSATWGLDKDENGLPPSLPKKLMEDPEVQEWLKKPHYNKKEEMKNFKNRIEEMKKIYKDIKNNADY